VLEISRGVAELRLGGSNTGTPCEVVVFAGENEPGMFAAGVDLWANGNCVTARSVVVEGSDVALHRFP